ncbi:hypothetical protein L9F63_005427, partial [Diploptera punctata]
YAMSEGEVHTSVAQRIIIKFLARRRQRTSITADNVRAVRDLIVEDRRVAISEIASQVGISFGSVQAIISDELKFRKLSASPDLSPSRIYRTYVLG